MGKSRKQKKALQKAKKDGNISKSEKRSLQKLGLSSNQIQKASGGGSNNPYGGVKGSQKAQPITAKQSQALFRDAMGITNTQASSSPIPFNAGRPGQRATNASSNRNYSASLQDRINYGSNKDLWDNVRKEMGLRPDQRGKSATTKMAQYVLSQGGSGLGGGGNGNGNGKDADRDSGKYEDILDAQGEDQQLGQDTADEFANMDPALGGISPELQAVLDDLMLANQNLGADLAQRDQFWNSQISTIQNSSQQALQSMQAMMLQQQNTAANTQNLLQSQLQSTQTALTNQQQMSANLANAYVPQAEQSAYSVTYGDSRSGVRPRQTNSLNDLSIVSGVGAGNSMSGLMLA